MVDGTFQNDLEDVDEYEISAVKMFCFPTNNYMLANQVDMTIIAKQNIINKPKQYKLSITHTFSIST